MNLEFEDEDPCVEVLGVRQQCIGLHENKLRCANFSPTDPPYPDHPNWPYLCPTCANAAPRKGSRNSLGIVLEKAPVL
jgi:hypothetical protein